MKHLAILMLLGIAACTQLDKRCAENYRNSDASAPIRVIVCEALITNAIKSPKDSVAFVRFSDSDLSCLSSRLPKHDIRPESSGEFVSGRGFCDKIAKQKGLFFSVDKVELKGNFAIASGTCLSGGAENEYRIDLIKRDSWIVTNIFETIILDLH